ncbi:MAG: hypothetical protein HY744_22015 [Deltaproteobacteria bacterium]|nr:hypothetical protein [Deltaproteobacteria bacterium]
MPRADEPRCGACRHFVGDPAAIEAALPAVHILGSMFASVRGDAGLCRLHRRFLSARERCEDFTSAVTP